MRRAAVGAVLLYVVLALVAQRSLLPHLHDHVYDQVAIGNDCLLHVWVLAWDQHALATNPLGLCDANVFFPYQHTLLYSDHLLGLALLLAPLRLVTDNAVLVHNLATLAAPALDALALYALAFDLTGRAGAALVGGLLYGFAPMRFGADCCQIAMLVAWWCPLMLLFGRRAVMRNAVRPGILAGVALAVQGLTGIYLTAFFLPFLAIAHADWLRRFPLRTHRRGWAALLASEAVAVLVLLPFALAYRSVQHDLGASRSIVLNAILSLQPATLPEYVPVVTLGLLVSAGVATRRVGEAFRAERGLLLVVTLAALLLALGPAVPLPAGLGRVRGPYAMLLSVPGFDALRVPGRFLHVALIGGSLLAAGGFAAATARLPPRTAGAAVVAVLVAFLAEARPPSLATVPAPPPARIDPVYDWLAEQPADLTLVELPLDRFGQAASRYQYATTAHWKRTAIGSMGLAPPLYPWLTRKLSRFPDPDVLIALEQLGVTHAVVHRPPRLALDRFAQLASNPTSPLETQYSHERTLVLALRDRTATAPQPQPRGRPLDRSRWQVIASQAAERAPLVIDPDPATSWSSWGDLEEALAGRWYDPVPFLERWRRFLEAQPVRLEIDLGAPARVTGIVLRLAGSDPPVAPALVLEASPDGASWTPLPGELDPVPDARALVTHAAEQRFALALPVPVLARALRLSCNGFEWHLGDLQAYAE